MTAAMDRDGGLEVLDPTVLEQLEAAAGAGGPELVSRLIEAYRRDAGALLYELEAAGGRADREGALRAAHTLRGTSSLIGARALPRQCQQLERPERGGESLSSAVASIKHEHDRLLLALAALIGAK
jgi:HPt (histidine-containing phosphotransfer) domain-containing protein